MVRVGVVGSVNLDVVATTDRLPQPGETVGSAVIDRYPGGKGANQALAARRMGAEVSLVARVGRDPEADQALALLREAGVDLSRSWRDLRAPTGVALITVDPNGENQIVVAPGANSALAPSDIKVGDLPAVIVQFEIPVPAVEEAARQASGLFCVNAAPARRIGEVVLRRADVIIVNEVERAELDAELERFDGLVVVTLGAKGAAAYRRGRQVARAEPPPVEATDTVGSGDAFVGAFVVSLLEERSVSDALSRSCAAGALAATVRGAQPSLPTAEQVEAVAVRG
jgi:ribokinase